MGCADLFNCFKPVPHKLQDAKSAPNQPRGPPTAPVSARGGPSNEAAPPNGLPFHHSASPYGISKASTSTPCNHNAIEEVSNHTSVSEMVKLRTHHNYDAMEEVNFHDNAEEFAKENPRPRIDWVIGLDFGTTYSGFAYARMQEDPPITVYYDWPSKCVETPYCKTLTGLYYKRSGYGHLECASWGYNARSEYMDHRGRKNSGGSGHYLTKFKLLLKPTLMKGVTDPLEAACIPPPPPLTRDTVITEYLRSIGGLALSVLQNHVGDAMFSRDSVQWCVTVPSIWDDNAKQKMREYMVTAGLVSADAGGVDAVKIVLEPEAASFHCHKILREHHRDVSLGAQDKILVADVGGGTVDIVVQELVASGQSFKVKELTESSGGLCGGTFVDDSFMRFLSKKIECLDEFLENDYPYYRTQLLRDWEKIKCGFGHEIMSGTVAMDINLHNKLAQKWEYYEKERGNLLEDSSTIHLTEQDLKSIFDKVVDEILELIAAQLKKVPDIKVMFVVGGFAGSPYLMQRIRGRFAREVTHIVSPPNPGSAIVQGAVSLALHPDAIVSRIAKKTYGTSVTKPFDRKLDPPKFLKVTDGVEYCMNRFDVYAKKGSAVEFDKCVVKNYVPHGHGQRQILFDLFSSDETEPRYASEGESVRKEGGFLVDLPAYHSRDEAPLFDFSMYFGRELIELKAVRKLGERVGQEARTKRIPVKYYS